MKTTRSKLTLTTTILVAALVSALALATVRAADLTPAETKDIAEEGFIYGLPIVMNYAVMYEFAVDRSSGQFKAPFNRIYNLTNVATYKDTAVGYPKHEKTHFLFLFCF